MIIAYKQKHTPMKPKQKPRNNHEKKLNFDKDRNNIQGGMDGVFNKWHCVPDNHIQKTEIRNLSYKSTLNYGLQT